MHAEEARSLSPNQAESGPILLAQILAGDSELYNVVEYDSYSELWFYFIPQDKKWHLLVIYSTFSGAVNDLDPIQKTIKASLNDWLPPVAIDLVILQKTELTQAASSSAIVVNGEKLRADSRNTYLLHNLDKDGVRAILGNPVGHKNFDKRPQLTWILSGVLLFTYFVQLSLESFYPSERWLMLLGVNRLNFYEGNFISLLSGTFLHGSWSHLLLNLLALQYLGGLASRFFSWKIILCIYLASATTGLLASVCFLENTSVGASGAIFGLAGTVLSAIWVEKNEMGSFHRFQFGKTSQGLLALLIINTFLPFIFPQIDFWGHTGGLLGGILLGLAFAWRRRIAWGVLSLILFCGLVLSLFIGANSQTNSFIAAMQAKEQAQSDALEWMNLRILPLQKELEFLMKTKQTNGSSNFDEYLAVLDEKMKQYESMSPSDNPIREYLELLNDGIRILRSHSNFQNLRHNWMVQIELQQRKVMDSHGLIRKSESF